MRLPQDGPLHLRHPLWYVEEEDRSHFDKHRVWYILLIVVAFIINIVWIYYRYCRKRTLLVQYVTLVTPGSPTAGPVDAPVPPPPPPPYCKDDPRMSAGHI